MEMPQRWYISRYNNKANFEKNVHWFLSNLVYFHEEKTTLNRSIEQSSVYLRLNTIFTDKNNDFID